MTSFKYFTTCQNQTVELSNVGMADDMFDVVYGGFRSLFSKPYRFQGRCPSCGSSHLAQRAIKYKSNPSLHVCSAKCTGGKVNGACECSCRGKNHGAGAFADAGAFRAAA